MNDMKTCSLTSPDGKEIRHFIQSPHRDFMLEHTVCIGFIASRCYETKPELFSIKSSIAEYSKLKALGWHTTKV